MTDRNAESGRALHLPEELPADRFNAFSDGVFAIAITLLVLELPVPTGSDLLGSLVEAWPEFLGYLISFVFIGGIWMAHARATRLMRESDTLAAGINLLALLFIALLPFSTSLMVENLSGPDARLAVLIYGINVLVASLMLTLLMAYLVRQPLLLRSDIADEVLAALTRQRWILECCLSHRGRLCSGRAARGCRALRPGNRAGVGPAGPPGASPLTSLHQPGTSTRGVRRVGRACAGPCARLASGAERRHTRTCSQRLRPGCFAPTVRAVHVWRGDRSAPDAELADSKSVEGIVGDGQAPKRCGVVELADVRVLGQHQDDLAA